MRTSLRAALALFLSLFTAVALIAPATAAPAGQHRDGKGSSGSARSVQPLERAHAHNDYEHTRPLLDALDQGFTSVEADVWLVDGQLYIGHDEPDMDRTLANTYLEPLRQQIARNRGAVYRGYKGRFRLYIDVKSGPETWPVIERELSKFDDIVTRWEGNKRIKAPVEAVISGARDLPAMEAAKVRYSAYDGRLPDLYSGIPSEVMTVVSDNFTNNFTWRGEGPMPAAEKRKLHTIVKLAHKQGYEVRFWATPDAPGPARDAIWRELIAADVDQINTDDLSGLANFLKANDPTERRKK